MDSITSRQSDVGSIPIARSKTSLIQLPFRCQESKMGSIGPQPAHSLHWTRDNLNRLPRRKRAR